MSVWVQNVANSTVIVAPPPPLPYSFGIVATDAVKAEGDAGTATFTFTVTRYGDATGPASIGWWSWGANSSNQAAPSSAPSDFGTNAFPAGTVAFLAGQTTQTLSVAVPGDFVGELDEEFVVHLDDLPFNSFPVPPGAATSAAGVILNDDAVVSATWNVAPVTAIANVGGDPQFLSITEADSGTTALSFVISRMGDIAAEASVQWSVVGNGANGVSGSDFQGGVLPGGVAQFAANQRLMVVTVYVAGDLMGEANEGYQFVLSNASTGTGIDIGAAHGVIYDTDTNYYTGTSGNNTINTSADPKAAVIDASQGGNDIVTGGANGDTFILGAALNSNDRINGGAGKDVLSLNGNYSAGITLGSSTVTNVEMIMLAGGNSYRITTNDATVAAGNKLTIDASALGVIDSATVNGAAEKSGGFIFLGGAGADNFTGGAGADNFTGGGGADAMKGNNGADIFRYLAVGDSPLALSGTTIDTSAIDQIASFQAGTDKLDLHAFGLTGAAASVVTKTSTAFTATLAKATGFFGTAGVAVEYASSGRTVTTRVYVDANGDHNLGTGDTVIQLTGVSKNGLTASSITF